MLQGWVVQAEEEERCFDDEPNIYLTPAWFGFVGGL
jgi:hypothetical protein